jgi:hypothetical protein
VFPLYHVLADFGEFAGGEVIPVESSAPLEVAAMTLRKSGKVRVLVANLSPAVRYVRINDTGLGPALLRDGRAQCHASDGGAWPTEKARGTGSTRRAVEVALLPYA